MKNPYRYRGYRYDTETGLYYLRSRYYNPEWGRFINADDTDELTAEDAEILDANLFIYCLNDPVNNEDSNGYRSMTLRRRSSGTAMKLAAGAVAKVAGTLIGTRKLVSSGARAVARLLKAKAGPIGKAGRKSQGREVNEKKRKSDKWESRSNKSSNRPMKKHTPGRGHRKR